MPKFEKYFLGSPESPAEVMTFEVMHICNCINFFHNKGLMGRFQKYKLKISHKIAPKKLFKDNCHFNEKL
jgi:hypothetical protein